MFVLGKDFFLLGISFKIYVDFKTKLLIVYSIYFFESLCLYLVSSLIVFMTSSVSCSLTIKSVFKSIFVPK